MSLKKEKRQHLTNDWSIDEASHAADSSTMDSREAMPVRSNSHIQDVKANEDAHCHVTVAIPCNDVIGDQG